MISYAVVGSYSKALSTGLSYHMCRKGKGSGNWVKYYTRDKSDLQAERQLSDKFSPSGLVHAPDEGR